MKFLNSKLDDIIQNIIPVLLVLFLFFNILDLFYNILYLSFFVDVFDLILVCIFAVDLYFRWQESINFGMFIKKHYLDIIATIPFSIIFIGIDYLTFIKALRGIRFVVKFSYFIKFLKFLRIALRVPKIVRVKKNIKEERNLINESYEKKLNKALGFKVILLITINSIMGTGIWFLTAAGAKHAGPASLISWLILSIVSIYIAMCFSELTSMFPKAGGVYEFAKQTYGRFGSFIVGWITSISGSVTISMLLLGALQYMIPIKYSFLYIPLAIGLVLLFNYVAYKGLNTSTYMLITFAIITIATIIMIIIPGFFRFNIENLTPFFVFPTINIFLAMFFISETFFGWESAIFLSSETKDPKRVMPKALIIGTIVIAIFALLLTLTAIGVMPWETYGQSDAPLRDLGQIYFGDIGSILFTILVSVSIIGAVASWVVTAPRLLMSIAEDKLFFVQFSKIHPKYKSPYVSIIFQVIIVSILIIIGAGSYSTLLHLLIPLVLVLYSSILLSVVILRFKKPNIERKFKVPFGKVGPLIVILFMIFLFIMFTREIHGSIDLLRISSSLILFGIPAYFAIELFYDKKYIIIRKNMMALIFHYYNYIPFSNKSFRKILKMILPIGKDSVIVDYNAGVGSFVRELIKMRINFKKVYAIDDSKEEIKVFKENIPIDYKDKIHIDHRISWRIPSYINEVDLFFSSDSLGSIENIPFFLKNVKRVLKNQGKFCFYIKHSILNVTSNALIIEDEIKLREMFENEDLYMNYKRKKGLFKEEIFIYGHRK